MGWRIRGLRQGLHERPAACVCVVCGDAAVYMTQVKQKIDRPLQKRVAFKNQRISCKPTGDSLRSDGPKGYEPFALPLLHNRQKMVFLLELSCHPYAGAMLIFSVSFQFYQMPQVTLGKW
jgi:hypothetical protein